MSRMLTVLTFTLFQAALAQGPALRPITVSLLLSSSIREQATDVRSGALLALNAARLEFRWPGTSPAAAPQCIKTLTAMNSTAWVA